MSCWSNFGIDMLLFGPFRSVCRVCVITLSWVDELKPLFVPLGLICLKHARFVAGLIEEKGILAPLGCVSSI